MIELFLLVIGGAFLWSVTLIIQKHFLKEKKVGPEVMTVAVMLGAGLASFVFQLILVGIPKVSMNFWVPFAITAILNIVIQYGAIKAQALEDVSITSALGGLTPLFVVLTSWILLGEFPTTYGLLGIIVITLGVYTFNLKGGDIKLSARLQGIIPERLHQSVLFYGAPLIRLFSSKGAILALLTAILASIALIFDKMAVLNSNPMIFTGGAFLVVAISVYGVSKATGNWKKLDKSHFWSLFATGLIFLGMATVLMNSGFFFGIVPYVGALKRIQIVFTVIFASIFLGEKYGALRLLSAAMIVIGILFLAF